MSAAYVSHTPDVIGVCARAEQDALVAHRAASNKHHDNHHRQVESKQLQKNLHLGPL
jgi:hypothetical protein